MKRHFSSDGGEEKFFQLTKTHFRWSYDEKKIATKFQSCKKLINLRPSERYQRDSYGKNY